MEPTKITVKGASEHNLKNISLEIPKKKLVVFTGVSGSGKSSLAFDILYAEGQRRYVESLSSYARQFLGQMPKPHYEYIRGLSPAISIEQKAASKNPRSTVGTVTEIYDYLRVLYAKIGVQHCVSCKKPVANQSPSEIVNQIYKEFDSKAFIWAPLVQNRKGEFKDIFEGLKSDGFNLIRINNELINLLEVMPELDKKKKHNLELLIDRIEIKPSNRARVFESVETALKYGKHFIRVEDENGKKYHDFSQTFACTDCGISYKDLSPQSFSFNSPIGMCQECNGLGYKIEVDPNLVVPHPEKSIRDGAIALWSDSVVEGEGWDGALVTSLISQFNINTNIPWRELPEDHKNIILYGTGNQKMRVNFTSKIEKNEWTFYSSYQGIINRLRKKFHETQSEKARLWYSQFMREMNCGVCNGTRLKAEYRNVFVDKKSILNVCELPIIEVHNFFKNITLSGNSKLIASEVLKEVLQRTGFLLDVGLNYLTLNRRAPTLSGGESQRIRLASQIGSELSGVMYILDEPSIGLHQRDNTRLLNSLKHLRDLGNTVIVIEHDEETIRSADHIVDFGPGAGVNGGKIVVSGNIKQITNNNQSITGSYLSKRSYIEIPDKLRKAGKDTISIINATENNLKIPEVSFPLNLFICVTGVSGAGKSSLINNVLVPGINRVLNNSVDIPGKHEKIIGIENIDKLINIDQKPIGKSSRSNPATYTKVYDCIREFYSNLPESKIRGYNAGRFSFNVKGGRCETCEGAGSILIEMHFLPDVYVECEVCKGKRFNDNTLDVVYKGKNIADILDLTVLEAYNLFENIPRIKNILKTLIDVGMDYVKIGQSSTTLSGGEAQRIKLSRELSKKQTGKTLYVLDEPTTGLHFDDIKKLLKVLHFLVDSGNTVIVIEHNLDVIKTADYIIDLGPEGGEKGGLVIYSGTPDKIIKCKKSYTGQYLKNVLNR